jgi:hypothetical protein
MTNHVLYDVLNQYTSDFNSLRDTTGDANNFDFHIKNGLFICVPVSWPVIDSVQGIILNSGNAKWNKFVIICSDLETQKSISGGLENSKVDYIIWHQIYTALKRVDEDTRYFKSIKEKLSVADLVLVVGKHDIMHEVLDQIRAHTDNCLIMINC